ncbi:MAG: PPC domain-containing DNA-binding protein [Candidatus Hodarchaeota archaeon]
MRHLESKIKRTIVAKLEIGDDVLESIERLAKIYSITNATFMAIGAVGKAKLGYWKGGKYSLREFNQQMEIVSCTGNILLKNGEPLVHGHIVVSDSNMQCFGGHLFEGCIISVTGEVFVFELASSISRSFDEQTELFLMDI